MVVTRVNTTGNRGRSRGVQRVHMHYFRGRNFRGTNFRDFANFGQNEISQNGSFANVYSLKKTLFFTNMILLKSKLFGERATESISYPNLFRFYVFEGTQKYVI